MDADSVNWAPLTRTQTGIDEIEADWVARHAGDVEIIDVREPDEFTGPLGHIDGARSVPLARLDQVIDDLPRDRPIVAVCLVGGRSELACQALREAGFERIANLAGGMIRWHQHALPVTHEN